MKFRRIHTISAMGLAGLIGLAAVAAPAEKTEPQPRPAAAGRGPGMRAAQLDRLTQELGLTDEQKTRVEALQKKQTEKLRAARAESSSFSPEQRREKMRSLRGEMTAELKKILKPEQFEKYQKLQAERTRRVREGSAGGGAPAPKPDQPAEK